MCSNRMSNSQLEIKITEENYSPSLDSTPTSPSLLSPRRDGNSQTNSFNYCSDLIDYFDNKFIQHAQSVLDDLRESLPKRRIITKVNALCAQMNTLNDILTSLQQDLIQQLLKNVNFELRVRIYFNKLHVLVYNKCILAELAHYLSSLMYASH